MNFWDSSALVPLLVAEENSSVMLELHEQSKDVFVWILTPVEILSALTRLQRTGYLADKSFQQASLLLQQLKQEFTFVKNVELVTTRAERILRTHPLKAADSLQLAAALVACQDNPENHYFVTLDEKLGQSAQKEGFQVLPKNSN